MKKRIQSNKLQKYNQIVGKLFRNKTKIIDKLTKNIKMKKKIFKKFKKKNKKSYLKHKKSKLLRKRSMNNKYVMKTKSSLWFLLKNKKNKMSKT